MLKLLGRNTSNNVQKVLWLLQELEQPVEHENLGGPWGGNLDADYLARNPNGTVPTLIDGDGVDDAVVWESNSILRYLAQSLGADGVYPQPPLARSQVERWMDWQLGTLSPAFRPLYIGLVRERQPLAALVESHAQCSRLFALLEQQLARGHGIAGPDLTLADFAIGPMVHRWFALGLADPNSSVLQSYYASLCSRPAFDRHVVTVALA